MIAMVVQQGLPLLLGQFAVLQAEAAFLLVDPLLPPARVDYLLSDSCAVLILLAENDAPLESTLPVLHIGVMPQAGGDSVARVVDSSVERLLAVSDRLAYVCYTSGSTGRPKGVAVNAGALRHYCNANAEAHGIGARSRVLLTSAVSFDPCIGEAWTALLAGATLCLPTRAMVREALGQALRDTSATHVCSTPALWATIEAGPTALSALECITLGGERMTPGLIARWASHGGGQARLLNIYGVTECCVYQSSHPIRSSRDEAADGMEASLIGVALPGNTLHLLDEDLHEVDDVSEGPS